VIAVDTNILVYGHRVESPFHDAAKTCLLQLRGSRSPWALPWSVIHEFIGVVTNPRIYKVATPITVALAAVEALTANDNVYFLGESAGYLEKLSTLCIGAKIEGARIHDARIAALCLHHGVSTLLTADRDFSLFPALKVKNPLIG
jgi:toxin-antitoxin system PIN domain toxin